MKKKIYLTPGPGQLFFTIEEHVKNALKKQILSVSHKSKAFEKIYREAAENLRNLLNIPEDFLVFFTSSNIESWDKIILNLVEKDCCHFVNGAFSEKFYQAAVDLNKNVSQISSLETECPNIDKILLSDKSETIAITINETSTGTCYPEDVFGKIRDAFPDQLIVVDATSALPYFKIDFKLVDTIMFSVQHGFGCPPGLGVLLMNRRSIEKAGRISRKHPHLGNFHDLTNYYSRAIKNQTPAPPNILGIYLLARICEDMLIMGIDRIRRETIYKAAVLYNTYEKSPLLKPFIEKNEFRSKTVINAETSIPSNEIIARLAEKGIVIGPGHEKYKFKQIRIANYPTHSKEQFELIADLLENLS